MFKENTANDFDIKKLIEKLREMKRHFELRLGIIIMMVICK